MTTIMINRLLLSGIILFFMAVIARIFIKLFRIKSPRFQALIWFLIMLKPIFILVVGSPFSFPVKIPSGLSFSSQRQISKAPSFEEKIQPKKPASPVESSSQVSPSVSSVNNPILNTNSDDFASSTARISYDTSKYSVTDGIMFMWIFGVGISLALFTRSRILLNRLYANSRAFLSPRLKRILPDICREMNIKRIPRIHVSHDIQSPALAGFISPRILIPAWLDHDECGAELRWILRHELMHMKMKDPLGLFIRRIFTSLFFFHPVAWYVAFRWLESAEKACDRALVQNEDDVCFYVKTLYKIIEYIKENKKVCRAEGLFATRSRIGKRIASLLKEGIQKPARISGWQGVLITGITLFVLAFNPGFIQKQTTALEEKSIIENFDSNPEPEKTIPKIKEEASENKEDISIVSIKVFSGEDGTRPKGWEIFGAPEEGFWFIQNRDFVSGNGDDLIKYNSEWSYAIYKDARLELPLQNLRVKFSMLQINGKLALIAGWKDENNHIRGVLSSIKEKGNQIKRSLIIEQVKNGEAILLATLVSSDEKILEPFENMVIEGDKRTLEIGINGKDLTITYNNKRKIIATVDPEDLRGGYWGLGIWFNMVKFHTFELFDPRVRIAEKENLPPMKNSPFKITQTFPYRIIIATDLSPSKADNLSNQLETMGFIPIQKEETGKNKFTVLFGSFQSREEAEEGIKFLMKDGFTYKDIIRSTYEHALPGYRIRVGQELGEDESKELQKRLKQLAYSPIIVKSSRESREILVGRFNSEEEALASSKCLEKDGFPEINIVKDPQFYTVLIREWEDFKWAELLKESLQNEGYYPISIQESDSSYKVTMGDFPERKDAEELAKLLKKEGYSATVITQP